MKVIHHRGTIIWAVNVPDKHGGNPKDRFVLLIKDHVESDPCAFGVAITGEFPTPPEPQQTEMSYGPNCSTGLKKPCVADSGWIVRVVARNNDGRRGFSTGRELKSVFGKLPAALKTALGIV